VSENERQQRMIERVQEDERLRGDLPDDAATALVEWASQRVATAAAEPSRPDAEVEAEVQAIRAAARAAARAGETDPQRLLALAETELAQSTGQAARPTATPPVAEQPALQVSTSGAEQPAPVPTATPPIAEQPAPTPLEVSPAAEQLAEQASTTNLAAGVGAGAAQSRPPAASNAEQPQHKQTSPWFSRWKPFASFLKRIRGDR
jgi:hypothetical protein